MEVVESVARGLLRRKGTHDQQRGREEESQETHREVRERPASRIGGVARTEETVKLAVGISSLEMRLGAPKLRWPLNAPTDNPSLTLGKQGELHGT